MKGYAAPVGDKDDRDDHSEGVPEGPSILFMELGDNWAPSCWRAFSFKYCTLRSCSSRASRREALFSLSLEAPNAEALRLSTVAQLSPSPWF